MTRHYKLSTGSASSGNGERRGRSSICERYSKDWNLVGKGDGAVDLEESPAASCPASPMPGATDGSTGGTAEPSLVEDCLQDSEFHCLAVEEAAEGATLVPPTPSHPKSLSARLHDWTCEDVCTWAASMSMASEVVKILRDNAINGNVLTTLSEDDLCSMGMHKLGWRRQLICRRDDALSRLAKSDSEECQSEMPASARPSNSILHSARDMSPFPSQSGGMLRRTPSSLRCSASAGTAGLPRPSTAPFSPPSMRSPHIADLPTPARSGAGTARGTRCTSTKVNMPGSLTQSFTPLPKKLAFAPPGCQSVPRSASSWRVRPEDSSLSVGMLPRSVSCIHARASSATALWQITPPSVVISSISSVPVVSAAPVGAVISRTTSNPFAFQVTVRPLSPSSGRVRQAPPLRRVRSSDRLERFTSMKPLSPSSGRVRQAPARHVVRRSSDTAESHEASIAPSDVGSARSSSFIPRASIEQAVPVEVATLEGIFGAVANSWDRVNREMEQTIAEDFKELQRQFSHRFDHEVETACTEVGNNSNVKRFETH